MTAITTVKSRDHMKPMRHLKPPIQPPSVSSQGRDQYKSEAAGRKAEIEVGTSKLSVSRRKRCRCHGPTEQCHYRWERFSGARLPHESEPIPHLEVSAPPFVR